MSETVGISRRQGDTAAAMPSSAKRPRIVIVGGGSAALRQKRCDIAMPKSS
jgi:hypothetical protein